MAELFFDGKKEAAKKRIQKLKGAGVIRERNRLVNEPAILYLTQRGLRILQQEGVISGYPPTTPAEFQQRVQVSPRTINHELEVLDIKSGFVRALRNHDDFQLTEFTTWPALYKFRVDGPASFRGSGREILPDGFVEITRKDGSGRFSFFLEVDRSTEKQELLAAKASCYVDFYKTGGFAMRCGGSREDVSAFPFRILLVFQNEERRNNAAAAMLTFTRPIFRQAWLATVSAVTGDPLGTVWICPEDYGEATKGTPFDPFESPSRGIYRRQRDRELMVKERIKRHKLL